MAKVYETQQPQRSEIDAMPGLVALEFGTNWCGWCSSGSPHIAAVLADHPEINHIKVEDGPGRPLGRSLRVKLWPTVVLLKEGAELARVVRPGTADEVRETLEPAIRA